MSGKFGSAPCPFALPQWPKGTVTNDELVVLVEFSLLFAGDFVVVTLSDPEGAIDVATPPSIVDWGIAVENVCLEETMGEIELE